VLQLVSSRGATRSVAASRFSLDTEHRWPPTRFGPPASKCDSSDFFAIRCAVYRFRHIALATWVWSGV